MSVNYLTKLQELTQTNLEILQAINKSFSSKNDHIAVDVNGASYIIPSFISLENKLNSLRANFDNLINAPLSGEAYFNMDGNSRAIHVRDYAMAPDSLVLNPVTHFETEQNNIFKDFLTPNPYVTFDVSALPNDITSVVVKKVVPKNEDLINHFKTATSDAEGIDQVSKTGDYKDLKKKLDIYTKGSDYIEYDTVVKLPIKQHIGTGIYIIEKIIKDEISDALENFITLKIRTDAADPYMSKLYYRMFDETIETPLQKGDTLLNFDGTAKMEIVEIDKKNSTIKCKVLNGEYLNFSPYDASVFNADEVTDNNKIRFYSTIDFDLDKIVRVPLEEDEYVFISIAGLNEIFNVQSSWGTGSYIHVDELKFDNTDDKFRKFYNDNVKNIGDALYEISNIVSQNMISRYTPAQYKLFTEAKPVIDPADVKVVRVNTHLDDSTTLQNIRTYYSQKQQYQNELNEVDKRIEEIQTIISTNKFNDISGNRNDYLAELAQLGNKKSELSNALLKVIQDIANAANNAEVPIKNAKYRIRGFIDIDKSLKMNNIEFLKGHIKTVRVQYKYKSPNQTKGTAFSINEFIFSDWNEQRNFVLETEAKYIDGQGFTFEMEPDNGKVNVPSFNQIDIPITQGETVDIRVKFVYDMSYPLAAVSSDWSDIFNIEFPVEFIKDLKILDIIDENNQDVERRRLEEIIINTGIVDHVRDKQLDQDITYLHKPEHIASGFLNSNSRIIPLKDKLQSMDGQLIELWDEVMGTAGENLEVSIENGDSITRLMPYQKQQIFALPYSSMVHTVSLQPVDGSAEKTDKVEGNYVFDYENNMITGVFNLVLRNPTKRSIKLYSMFPGSQSMDINNIKNYKYAKEDYCVGADGGVFLITKTAIAGGQVSSLQKANQFITFRINDINDNSKYYVSKSEWDMASDYGCYEKGFASFLEARNNGVFTANDKLAVANPKFAFLYPIISDKSNISLNTDIIGSFLTMLPGDELVIPIIFEYRNNISKDKYSRISRTMSFDVRTSLYRDPICYTFSIAANNFDTSVDKIMKPAGFRKIDNKAYASIDTPVKYNPIR